MKSLLHVTLLSVLVLTIGGCQTSEKKVQVNKELIPREVLFGNPDITGVQISPDGQQIAYLAEHQGVLNIWVQSFGKPETAKPVTNDTKRGIFSFDWTFKPGTLAFSQDRAGDENYGLYTLNTLTGETTEIAAPGKTQTNVTKLSHTRPDEVVIMTNSRDPKYFDYKILNLVTKKQTNLFTNKENFSGILFNQEFVPVLAAKSKSNGGSTIFLWNLAKASFAKKMEIPFEDSLMFGADEVSPDGRLIYLLDSRGQDKAALKLWDLKTDQYTVLASDERSDIQGIRLHPKTGAPLWATSNYFKREVKFLDATLQKHFEGIQKELKSDIVIPSMSLEADQWVVLTQGSNKPAAYYFYDVKKKKLSAALYARKSLLPYAERLNVMEPVEIESRDGFKLVSYLTRSKKQAGQSLILLVHGGPWGRDAYGYNPYHQWLSDRGYNVLSVNFRASTGFGKKFLNAGDGEWGRKMHDDLIDAVQWAVKKGYANEKQVVIMGGSYGGYAALAGLTFTPDDFAAGIDIVGPSNLETLLSTVPPYWESFKANLYQRVGNPQTASGRKLLKERSPLNHIEKIKKPLLILQGANDPRVKKAEADQIYNAMVAKKIPVEYVLFPDEGHGFAKAQNNMGANAIIEEFLQKILSGRLQPIQEHVKASSAEIITIIQK